MQFQKTENNYFLSIMNFMRKTFDLKWIESRSLVPFLRCKASTTAWDELENHNNEPTHAWVCIFLRSGATIEWRCLDRVFYLPSLPIQ